MRPPDRAHARGAEADFLPARRAGTLAAIRVAASERRDTVVMDGDFEQSHAVARIDS
jgi:hypothetical protein